MKFLWLTFVRAPQGTRICPFLPYHVLLKYFSEVSYFLLVWRYACLSAWPPRTPEELCTSHGLFTYQLGFAYHLGLGSHSHLNIKCFLTLRLWLGRQDTSQTPAIMSNIPVRGQHYNGLNHPCHPVSTPLFQFLALITWTWKRLLPQSSLG